MTEAVAVFLWLNSIHSDICGCLRCESYSIFMDLSSSMQISVAAMHIYVAAVSHTIFV